MPAPFPGDARGRRLTVERRGVEVALKRAFRVRHEVNALAYLIGIEQGTSAAIGDDHPVSGRQRADQLAVQVVEVEVLIATAHRPPDEPLGTSEKCQFVVEV